MNSYGNYRNLTDLAERVTRYVVNGDQQLRAATRLACAPLLLRKIGPYVDNEGWIEWDCLTADLLEGLPWSSGEKRLARLACSLSGKMSYRRDAATDVLPGDVLPWTLAELLFGLDGAPLAAALDAIHYAATGRPMHEAQRDAEHDQDDVQGVPVPPGKCPGCVGRGTGTVCFACGRPVPPLWRRDASSPADYRIDCPQCQAGSIHAHGTHGNETEDGAR